MDLRSHCKTWSKNSSISCIEVFFFGRLGFSRHCNFYRVYHESLFFFLDDLSSVGDTLFFRRRDLGFLFEAGSNGTGNSLWVISEAGTDCHVCFLRFYRGLVKSGDPSVTSSTCSSSFSRSCSKVSLETAAFKEGSKIGEGITSSPSCCVVAG